MHRGQKIKYILAVICFLLVLFPFIWETYWTLASLESMTFLDLLPIYRFGELESQKIIEDEKTNQKLLETDKIAQEEQIESENQTKEAAADPIQKEAAMEAAEVPHPVLDLSMEALSDYNYLRNQFYIIDSYTETNEEQLNAADFLSKDFSLEENPEKPQILIYHTHSQEGFVDSDLTNPEERIVGVGSYLTELLQKKYGYQVLHVKEEFDVIDGVVDRSAAYDMSEAYVAQLLEEYPSIEVVIDLHRDGVPEDRHLVAEINGKQTAQIMGFNGLSYTVATGPIEYLPNPYIEDNLAFSFQLAYEAAQYYPDLYRGIYLAGYRYNLQLKPRAILLEAGAQTNTLQEVKNAMEPFSDVLHRVLEGESIKNS